MANKYLSLEEAAELIGISTEELILIRSRGDIRGYADRGSWKFREDEVSEYKRAQRPDSDPDVPLYNPEVAQSDDTLDLSEASSDSDVRLVLDDDMMGEDSEPEISFDAVGDSDSDVRLVDQTSEQQSDSDVKIVGSDTASEVPALGEPLSGTESDVRIVDTDSAAAGKLPIETDAEINLKGEGSSDSDVKMVGSDSDSDVVLEPALDDAPLSDSDVKLSLDEEEPAFDFKSDSDVQLIGEKTPNLEGSDSDVALVSEEDIADESGISLAESEDSDVRVTGESGISLDDPLDSGISLEADDSGISLLDDDDSAISLLPDDDSGISIDFADDSGIALDAEDELKGTIPMMATPGGDATDEAMDVFDAGDTGDLLLEDDEDHASTMVGADTGDVFDQADSEFDTMDSGDFEIEDSVDDFSGEFDFDDEDSGESVSTMDEFDVFDADDDVFDEDFDESEEDSEFAQPMSVGRSMEAVQEDEWGGGVVISLVVCTLLTFLCSFAMIDLLRAAWGHEDPWPVTSSLLSIFG